MKRLTKNERIALDLLNELRQCTPEQLDKYELILMAESVEKGDNLKEFLRIVFKMARSYQPLAICMKEGAI